MRNFANCSSIACSFIAQSIVIEIVKLYEEQNITPPIYISGNTGGDEHNKQLYDKYKKACVDDDIIYDTLFDIRIKIKKEFDKK